MNAQDTIADLCSVADRPIVEHGVVKERNLMAYQGSKAIKDGFA
jgi:hypothetical protein